jgi:hypothetical protein
MSGQSVKQTKKAEILEKVVNDSRFEVFRGNSLVAGDGILPNLACDFCVFVFGETPPMQLPGVSFGLSPGVPPASGSMVPEFRMESSFHAIEF